MWQESNSLLPVGEHRERIKGIQPQMEKFESILVRWMNVEPILQSEVSQKEKNKHHILTHIQGFPVSLEGKESTCNTGDLSSIPEWGRPLEEGNGYRLSAPVFLLGEFHGQRSLGATVHRDAKIWTD